MFKIKNLLTIEGLWSLGILVGNNWTTILAVLAGGGVMGYLTYITDWLKPYGPVAWGAAAFGGALVALLLFWLWQAIASRRFLNRLVSLSIVEGSVNPRETKFEKQAAKLSSFYNDFYVPYTHKVFIDCDIIGPGILRAEGCTLTGVDLRNCQIVIVGNVSLYGVTVFKNSQFIRGMMTNITLAMTPDEFASQPPDVQKFMSVINHFEVIQGGRPAPQLPSGTGSGKQP